MTSPTDSRDPYASGMITTRPNILRTRMPLYVVGVLNSRREGRGLELIHPRTRCIRQGEIHELILTSDDAAPGGSANSVQYLGFFSFGEAAVVVESDRLEINGQVLGEVAGFDATHMPNHYNIVLRTTKLQTGVDLGIQPGDLAELVPWHEGNEA